MRDHTNIWWPSDPQARLSPHFRRGEFQCPCCAKLILDPWLLLALEDLRDLIGNRPITITSGYRCPAHNHAVGGERASQHLLGRAADIIVAGLTPHQLTSHAQQSFWFRRGAITNCTHGRALHVDVRERAPARWTEPSPA